MNQKILPVGLKGNEINERMKQLMGVSTINENHKTSVVELTKMGPDGKIYGVVRENHEYYIKVTNKKKNIIAEDFSYIGGLQNKKDEAYPSYAKAIKHLNLKFISLNEAYGNDKQINVFQNDKLLKEDIASFYQPTGSGFSNEGNLEGNEMSECCTAPMMEGMCSECGGTGVYNSMNDEGLGVMDEFDKPTMDKFKDQYGNKKGIGVYYATANKQDRDPETFEKNEGMDMDNGEELYNPIHAANAEYLSPMDRMHNSPEWVQAQRDAEGYDDDDDTFDPTMEAVDSMMEDDEMTDKEKKFAALAKPYDKITYADKIAGATKNEDNMHVELDEYNSAVQEMMEDEPFVPHGSYTVSNSGGYEVMLSDDGSMAKVKDAFGSDNPEISDWLEIEYVPNEDTGEMEPVIDPNGYNIPLSQTMRMRESKKRLSIETAINEMDEIINSIVAGKKKVYTLK